MNSNLNINSKECLSMDTLSQYAHDTLTTNDMAIVEEHINNCVLCSKIVEDLTPHQLHSINSIISNSNQKISSKIPSKPKNNLAKPILYGGISIATITILILGILNFNNSNNIIDTTKITQEIRTIDNKETNKTITSIIDTSQSINKEDSISFNNINTLPIENILTEPIVKENNPSTTPIIDINTIGNTNQPIEDSPKEVSTTNTIDIKNDKDVKYESNKKLQLTNVTAKIINKYAVNKNNPKNNNSTSNGQLTDSKNKTNKGFEVNKMPEPYGGDKALLSYIKDQVIYEFKDNPELKGRTTMVSFVVNSKGKIIDVETTTSINKSTDKKIESIIQNQPAWKAAGSRGKLKYDISITF